MIQAGACALQIENQVSDEKQCGHQDGKVTVPHDVFLAKIRACRHAFLELGVEDGIIVTRTDSLGAGLTQQIAVSHEVGDIGDQYNSFLDCEEVDTGAVGNGDVVISRNGKLMRPKRLASNLYQFRPGTGEDRCVLDCITSLQNGADLLWIETEKPHVEQIAGMVDRIRKVIPNAKLAYNNSPSFNWTLNFRQQVYDAWKAAGKDVSAYDRDHLMSGDYDDRARRRSRRAHPHLPGGRVKAGRHLPPPDHAADLSHRGAVDRQPLSRLLRDARACLATCATFSARRSARASPGQAPEHVRLRHRRRSQGVLLRRRGAEGRGRPQHDEPVRLKDPPSQFYVSQE